MACVYSRRWFVSRLGLIGCALPLTAYAQRVEPRRVRRIGFLIGPFPTLITAFDEELRRLGHADGTNLIIERRVSGLTSDIAELAQMDLDLIVAAALPVALEVRKVNPAMPMVIATCPGMVCNGFAKSLKRPGGIYTGYGRTPSWRDSKTASAFENRRPQGVACRAALDDAGAGRA